MKIFLKYQFLLMLCFVFSTKINAQFAGVTVKASTIPVTWNTTDKPVPSNAHFGIVIPNGATLNITGTNSTVLDIQFNSTGYITVLKGGALYINNARLRSNTSNNWVGITVQGAGSSYAQKITDRIHGYLSISNTSIQCANNGITVLAGGIAQCFRTAFYDCPYGIIFTSYTNPKPNLSILIECNFIWNFGTGMNDFIHLEGVNNISVQGCHFNSNGNGTGVYSKNSSCSIQPSETTDPRFIHDPCILYGRRCIFSYLNYGIKVDNGDNQTIPRVCIANNNFDSTPNSISLKNDYYTRVYQNSIYHYRPNDLKDIWPIKSSHTSSTDQNTYFTIDENIITIDLNECDDGVYHDWIQLTNPGLGGVVKNNTIGGDITCHLMEHRGLDIILTDYNSNMKVLCNTFNTLTTAISITGSNFMYMTDPFKYINNSITYSAGNVFNNNQFSSDIKNSTSTFIDYYAGSDLHPPTVTTGINPLITACSTNTCPEAPICAVGYSHYFSPYAPVSPPYAGNAISCVGLSGGYFYRFYESDACDFMYVPDSTTGEIPVVNIPYVPVKVITELSPNPSFSDITLSFSPEIQGFENYTVTINDQNQNTVFSNTYSGNDTIITIARASIGCSGNYTCTVTLLNNVDTNITFVLKDNIAASISPIPSYGDVTLTLTPIENCPSYSVQVFDQSNTLKYEGTYSNSPIVIPRSSLGAAGTYSCVISSSNVTDTTIYFVLKDNVVVSLTPNPSFSDINLSLTGIYYTQGYTIQIYDQSNNLKFQGTYNNTDNSITIPKYSIGGPGTYNCNVIVNNAIDTSIVFILGGITIYPNPTHGDINISLTGIEIFESYSVIIYDQNNNIKYQHTYSSSQNLILIPGSYMGTSGTYTVEFIANNTVIYATFVFELDN